MREPERRLARLEAMREYMDDMVDLEQLRRMAAIVLADLLDQKLRAEAERIFVKPQEDTEAECRRVREKILGDGPYVPAADCSTVDSEARRILRQKLLGPDDSLTAESSRA